MNILSKIVSKFVLLFLSFIFSLLQLHAQPYQHLIIYGQSLSTGHQSYPVISEDVVSGNYMIGEQIWINNGNSVFNILNPLRGTIAKASQSQPKTRAGQAQAECPLLGMANHLQHKIAGQYQFIATSTGTSGRTIEQLSKESQTTTHYNDFLKSIQSASLLSDNIICPALIWMQGEYNYTGTGTGLTNGSVPTIDKDEYKSLLIRLKNNMQSDIMAKYKQSEKPLFITYQTGVQYTRRKELTIGMAQLEASNEYDDIVCAGPVYPMTDRGGHLDPNGYRWFGEMLAKVYYKTKILGEDFKPLYPKKITREADGKTLKILFHVPVPPLVFDELTVEKISDYGFEVYDNNIRKSITDISIDGDFVLITCSTVLTGVTEIIYAGYNASVRGHGNLRDSDSYSAYYTYLDLDKKINNQFVYERDASESTLRPSYEPRDTEGIIYDKPYPLYNFGVAFYFKLNPNQGTEDKDYIPKNYYVKTTGSIYNSGLSWTESTTLNNALLSAKNTDTIHIAAGMYQPLTTVEGGNTSDSKDNTFEIKNNVMLIGGYPYNAIDGATADYKTNPTVLDGGGNYHVLVVSAKTMMNEQVGLRGLKITGGAAVGGGNVTANGKVFGRGSGGGINISGSVVSFEDCEITNNSAGIAGGVYVTNGAKTIFKRCNVSHNRSTGNSGAFLITGASEIVMYDSRVSFNSADGIAGAIQVQSSKSFIYNSTFDNNKAVSNVGGCYLREDSENYWINTTIYGNESGGYGGGLVFYGTATSTSKSYIISSTISKNKASTTGGGVNVTNSNGFLSLKNTVISQNIGTNEVNGTYEKSYSIIGNKVYDEYGIEVSELFFTEDMLDKLQDNGGFTPTCLLIKENNPAKDNGMSKEKLVELAGNLSVIDTNVIEKDQFGNNRDTSQSIGALIYGINSSNTSNAIQKQINIYSQKGRVCVKVSEPSKISIYNIYGACIFMSNNNVSEIDISLSVGVYFVKIGNNTLKTILN
jgi:hypothetical protein